MKTIIIDGIEYNLTPKVLFKKGDWIIDNNIKTPFLITGISNGKYDVISIYGNDMVFSFNEVERFYHLWTIQDAKDGDVLTDGDLPFIFKKIDTNGYSYAYCGISADDRFKIESDGEHGELTWMLDLIPATKEQRDTLKKAMADAGYTFDFEKKELRKIEQTPWSEEDEYHKRQILRILKDKGCSQTLQEKTEKWIEERLKSIRPQNSWKPSEEQVNTLWDAIVFVEGCNSNFKGSGSVLENLYNDLKKLSEE